jgi:hypothetical protein
MVTLYAQKEPAVMTVQDVEGPALRLVDLVRTRYVFPDVAEKICALILGGLESGEYQQADSNAKLVEMLTADLQSTNLDRHLTVNVNPDLVKTILLSQGEAIAR